MRPMSSSRLPRNDLLRIIQQSSNDLFALKGKVLFITGGSGFIGSWLIECLCQANQDLDLKISIKILTRQPRAFASKYPYLYENPLLEVVTGDVRSLNWDKQPCDFVIHAATDTNATFNQNQPLETIETVVNGTQRVLEYSKQAGVQRVLLLSSGGVYGQFPQGVTHIQEDAASFLDTTNPYFTYAESKRMSEVLGAIYHDQHSMGVSVARIFSVLGPRLPLDAHFAAGNFINDALHLRPIKVNGDGKATRSYIYSADLIVWLLALLVRGRDYRIYNVGSDQALSIAELAQKVAIIAPHTVPVEIMGNAQASNPTHYYVPCIQRATSELGLAIYTPIERAIAQTLDWHLSQSDLGTTNE
jgi:nucleoside-diphosphate-sugar epimerase